MELLRLGLFFVDSPGPGSSIAENSETTERFFPEADTFVLITSYDSPLLERREPPLLQEPPPVFIELPRRQITFGQAP